MNEEETEEEEEVVEEEREGCIGRMGNGEMV